MSSKILERFESLIEEGDGIYLEYEAINGHSKNLNAKSIEWTLKAQRIIELACGENSNYLNKYNDSLKFRVGDTANSIIFRLLPILRAAKDDLENGFLITLKQIIQAEVFDSELDQARHFLELGYKVAAAVTAGVVLETAIKELCKLNNIDILVPDSNKTKKLDLLNSNLAKAGVYNLLQQKRITALTDVRNNAAHGNADQFNEDDVKSMIIDIEKFLLDYVS